MGALWHMFLLQLPCLFACICLVVHYNSECGIAWWSIFHINQPKTIFLVRLCCSQHETDEEVIPSRQTKLACYQPNSLDAPSRRTKLACHQPASLVCLVRCQPIPPSYLIVWFALFVVNQSHRHIWRLDLSCCYPPSYLTAWSVLFVIHQFLLIITIAFKRGKQHQCRYIRFNGGLLCHFNPLKAVLSDCSHCFQKNWAHQCRCIRNNAGLLCRLISWKQCQSFMSPFPVWRKQYSMIIT